MLVDAFATELRVRRQELNWSQEQLSVRAEIDRAYISRLESGKKTPSLSVLYTLAGALDLSFSEFAGRVDQRYRALVRKAKRSPQQGKTKVPEAQ